MPVKQNNIIVFLGPTLPVDEAKALLPNVHYWPPIKCGDMIKALRLKPATIVIIDGHFEHTAAVWHKEIICAIQQGVTVIGASSMGALRAAELAPFGMQGVGRVFECYQKGIIEADDEVAVMHGSAEQGYRCVTEPMVNIRETVLHAKQQCIITDTDAENIIQVAKKLFYKNRILDDILAASLPAIKKAELTIWLQQGGYVNVKANDAKLALQAVRVAQQQTNQLVKQTGLLNKLIAYNNCLQITSSNSLTPVEKCTADAAALPQYALLIMLAQLLTVCYQWNTLFNANIPPANIALEIQQFDTYKKNVIDWFSQAVNSELDTHLTEQQRGWFDKFVLIFAAENMLDDTSMLIISCMAKLWQVIDTQLAAIDFDIDDNTFEQAVMKFRQQHNLATVEAMQCWFQQKAISQETLVEAFKLYAIYDYIIVNYNVDMFEKQDSRITNALFDALCLVGLIRGQ